MITSIILTGIVRYISIKRDFVARPMKDRYHQRIVALGGGIAIFWTICLGIVAGIAIILYLEKSSGLSCLGDEAHAYIEGLKSRLTELFIVLGCAVVLHIMGLIDDLKGLGPYIKLLIQFSVAIIAAWLGDIRVEFFIESKVITVAISAFWMVLIMNCFNFLDNMDGVSAGIALIVSLILITAAVISGQVFISAFGLLFIGTLIGYLLWNFPPAKIFMGDSGSLVIGFFVAMITLRTTYYQEVDQGRGVYAVFMPIIALAVPLYDFTSVTFLRITQGKSPFIGDTQHFSHRLKKRGLSDTQVTWTLYLATLCAGIGAMFLYQVDLVGAIFIFVQMIMILALIAIMETTGKDAE